MNVILMIIGNSHVRYTAWDGKNLGDINIINTASIKTSSHFKLLVAARQIFAVSVVPSVTLLLKKFASQHAIDLRFFTSKDYPFRNYTDEPEAVGADRLLAILGAKKLGYGAPLMIVDAGTAMTVNFADAGFGFEGGLIMPGAFIMEQALYENTGIKPPWAKTAAKNYQLAKTAPPTTKQDPSSRQMQDLSQMEIDQNIINDINQKIEDNMIGRNTHDAISKGCRFIFRGLMTQLAEKAEAENRAMVFTGGGFNRSKDYEPNLLFHGLIYWLNLFD